MDPLHLAAANELPRVSVIVLTYNEERNLPDCLRSLQGLNGEVFVVDSGSTDRTCQIASDTGAKVFSHCFDNYSAQRNWAQQNLPLSCSWVLHLDADERLTPALVAEINAVLQLRPNVAGFLLRKRTVFLGKWIKHGGHYPSYHLRLFVKDRGVCEDRLYDQHFVVSGPIGRLKHDYVDVLTSNLDSWTQRHLRWAALEAREISEGSAGTARVPARPLGSPVERRRWLREGVYQRAPLFVRCFAYWFYRYFLKLGFLDGREGLIFHFLQGLWFRLLIDVKLLEIHREISPQPCLNESPQVTPCSPAEEAFKPPILHTDAS